MHTDFYLDAEPRAGAMHAGATKLFKYRSLCAPTIRSDRDIGLISHFIATIRQLSLYRSAAS